MKKRQLLPIMMAAMTLMSAVGPIPTMAATQYTPVEWNADDNFMLKKYLIMSAGDNVPNVEFNFTIKSGVGISLSTDDNAVMEVKPGPIGEGGIVEPISFGPDDETFTTVSTATQFDINRKASERKTGATAATGVEFETAKGEKYAVKDTKIDIPVEYTEPGIYRYIIEETGVAADEARGIMHDNDTDRILDVYVTDDGTGQLKVAANVLHCVAGNVRLNDTMGSGDVTTAGALVADKTDGFTNEYKSKDLAFKKEVTGNQASRDKYFKFTLQLGGLTAKDQFTVSLANDQNDNTTDGDADNQCGTNEATKDAYEGIANPTLLTVADGSDTITAEFYLQHGQSIAVRGLPLNATYSVTEDKEDYKSEASKVTDYTKPTSGIMSVVAGTDKAVKTSYLNTRNGVIPTGIFETVGQFAGLMIAGLVGLIAATAAYIRRRIAK